MYVCMWLVYQAGIDVNAVNNGRNAYDAAVAEKHTSIAEFLRIVQGGATARNYCAVRVPQRSMFS
jgi:hypothetical protein